MPETTPTDLAELQAAQAEADRAYLEETQGPRLNLAAAAEVHAWAKADALRDPLNEHKAELLALREDELAEREREFAKATPPAKAKRTKALKAAGLA